MTLFDELRKAEAGKVAVVAPPKPIVDPAVQALQTELAAEKARAAAEREALSRASRPAIDPEIARKAALFDTIQSNPAAAAALTGKTNPLPADVQKLVDGADPAQRLAFEHIARQSVFESEETRQLRRDVQELKADRDGSRRVSIAQQAVELKKVIPEERFTNEVVATMEDLMKVPRFAGLSLAKIYEMASGEKVPAAKQPEPAPAKPPPESSKTNPDTTEVQRPRFGRHQLKEAGDWIRSQKG